MKTIPPERLETLLAATHAALHEAGRPQGVWERLRCTCARPGCEIRDPVLHTVTLQLDALAAFWHAGAAGPEEEAGLSAALVRLGDALALWEEGAPRPHKPTRLLHHVRDLWLSGMGTPLGGPPSEAWLDGLSRVEARNALLLEKLLERLAGCGFAALAVAGAAHARRMRARAAAEGRAACRRSLRAWMDDHDALPQRTLLREHLLALLAEAPWSAGEAQDVVRMAEDASHAVLAFGIAADVWVRAAYGGMEEIAPFAALRIALVLEDDPVSAASAS